MFCVGFLFISFPLSTFAYPVYQAGLDIVEAGGYPAIATGSANWGVSTHLNSYFLSINNLFRIRESGVIDHFAMYFNSKPASLTTFYIQIWRKKDTGLFDRIYSENVLSQISAGQISNLTPSTAWTVQEGDYIGYGFESSSAPGNFMLATTGYTYTSTYITLDSAPPATDFSCVTCGAYTAAPSIKVYMSAPQAVFIGDSIIAGGPIHAAYTYDRLLESRATTIEYQLSALTGYTYQNMGKGGDTTTGINNRFTTDVLNLKPKIVIIEGGVNDIAGSVAKSTFIANWTSMLAAAQADSNINTIIVLKILPWTNGTTVQMQTRDDWNASLATLAAGYSKVIVVDAGSYVGKFRTGGDTGNLWDIQTAYNADGVHYNQAGHSQIAQAIADALPKPSATFANDFSTWNIGSITANYNLIQTGGNTNTNISQTGSSGVEYSTDGSTWYDATKATGGDALTGLTSTASPGTSHSFVWDSATDLPNTEDSTVYLRIRPNDGTSSATDWVVGNAFGVDNNVPPTNVGITYITIDSPTQLTVVADTPTDSGSGLAASPYWFTETTGNPGASSSTDWQTSNTFTDSGLTSNVQYTYKVKVKDAAGNISDYSVTSPQTPVTLGGGGSSYTPTVTTPTTTTVTTSNPEEIASSQTPRNDEGETAAQPTQSTETTIAQLKSQLIVLITQLIQMLTEQVALMR